MSELHLRLVQWLDERVAGQGLVEYALILVFVSVAVFVALQALGTSVSSLFSVVVTDL